MKTLIRYIPGDGYFSSQRFELDWVALAKRYENSCVVAADLWDRPRSGSEQGRGGADGVFSDWNQAAERTGNAILAVTEQWLVIVQGRLWWSASAASTASEPPPRRGSDSLWSAGLRRPVVLHSPHKLVYASSECLCEGSPSSGTHPPVAAPVMKVVVASSSSGCSIRSDEDRGGGGLWLSKQWLSGCWVRFINGLYYRNETINAVKSAEQSMSWSCFSLSAASSANRNDILNTERLGLFRSDWSTVDNDLMNTIREAMAPRLL